MKIIFFTEWHSNTGKGHLSRCISLSEFLISKGFNPTIFVDTEQSFTTSYFYFFNN